MHFVRLASDKKAPLPRGRAVVARWVDKIYRYPRRRTALATLAGRLAGEFPIASEEMALVFHHLLSGHSAGADGVRATRRRGTELLQRRTPPPAHGQHGRRKRHVKESNSTVLTAAQAAYARIQWGCKRKVEYCTAQVLRIIWRNTHGTGN